MYPCWFPCTLPLQSLVPQTLASYCTKIQHLIQCWSNNLMCSSDPLNCLPNLHLWKHITWHHHLEYNSTHTQCAMQIPQNVLCYCPMYSLRYNHELVESIVHEANIKPGVDELVDQLPIQGWVHILILRCMYLPPIHNHRHGHRPTVLHPKPLQNLCSIFPLTKEDLLVLLPYFQA